MSSKYKQKSGDPNLNVWHNFRRRGDTRAGHVQMHHSKRAANDWNNTSGRHRSCRSVTPPGAYAWDRTPDTCTHTRKFSVKSTNCFKKLYYFVYLATKKGEMIFYLLNKAMRPIRWRPDALFQCRCRSVTSPCATARPADAHGPMWNPPLWKPS